MRNYGIGGLLVSLAMLLAIPVNTFADESAGQTDRWKKLSNGKDLIGWTVRSGTAKFEVVDGIIVGTTVPMSPNSFLCTDREFSDFELELEVLCDPELNSGIQVRSQIAEEGKQVTSTKYPKKPKTITLPKDRVYGYQVEIAKAESGRSGGVYDEARRFVFLDDLKEKPKAQLAFKNDQWNRIRIRCEGDRIQTWVNDVPCADVRDEMDSNGIIGLQVHGNIAVTGRVSNKEYHKHQVRFRNIRIRELTTVGQASSLSNTNDWLEACHTKPNILLIVADDLGFSDLGCYGGEIETPNLDQLAENGLRLTQFYTTGRCCPSRASLLTGRYPHRVGLGHMTQDIGQPGYQGQVSKDARTIAQQLSGAGYRSFLSGKWHLGTDDPTQHGFEEFYGTLTSAKTFWDADHYLRLPERRREGEGEKGREESSSEPQNSPSPRLSLSSDSFYGTDALADHAIEFLNTARETPDNPWFLYLAINAPHFPLQAPKSLIEKYADRYIDGWDVARQRRLVRMKKFGIVPKDVTLSPRSPHFDWGESTPADNPAWDSLEKDRQADLARRMAIYAAMVDSMDQNIGRVLNDLRERGELENTLIVFTSDNGACAEWDHFGFDIKSSPNNKLHRGDEIEAMGSPGTFHSAGSGWANVSNTPWRLYKHYNHEGGIAVPCIVHWPARMQSASSRRGAIDETPAHLIDILPTFTEAAYRRHPAAAVTSKVAAGSRQYDVDGASILPLLDGEKIAERQLFFEHEGNRAVRDGQWKLVALRDQPWELYDMQTDRTELNNLVAEHPETVARLSTAWDAWAAKNHVTPLPNDYHVEYVPAKRIGGILPPEQTGSHGGKMPPIQKLTSSPVRKLAEGFRFTEGPAWDGKGNLYFSDIPNKTLHRLSENGKVDLIRTGAQASNGIVIGSDGELIFCEVGGRRIVARSKDGKETTLADSCDDKPIGMPNDLWMAPDGGIYFTIPFTNKQRAKVVPPDAVNATVCYISPDRKSIRDVGIGLKNANGIVGSSDGKRLYVADPRSQKCWRYSIQADGSLSDQRLAADQASDGLALDELGNLYTTSKLGINVYSPDAKLISTIVVPESPANMKFGGDDGHRLFITARTGIYSVQMKVNGDIGKQPVKESQR